MSHWKVIYTQLAERDLRSIYEYITFSLLEPETASKQARRILDAIAKLNDFPHRFKIYQNEPWLGKGLRVMPVDNYLVFLSDRANAKHRCDRPIDVRWSRYQHATIANKSAC